MGQTVYSDSNDYPVRFTLPIPPHIANWRPLVHWLLVIPHMIVLFALGIVAWIATVIGFFAVLFTRRWPASVIGLVALYFRYELRTMSYAYFLREDYPPFAFPTSLDDPGGDPATFDVDDPGEMQRFAPIYQWILAIPHFIILFFLAIAAWFVVLIGFFAVLFTGRWPLGLASFVIGVTRWNVRVSGYAMFLTNDYPPFAFD